MAASNGLAGGRCPARGRPPGHYAAPFNDGAWNQWVLTLRRRLGLWVWAFALIWNVLGLADIVNGQAIAAPSAETANMRLPPIIYLIPISLSAAQIASIWLLTRRPIIDAITGNRNVS
jgi:hypothetical protein